MNIFKSTIKSINESVDPDTREFKFLLEDSSNNKEVLVVNDTRVYLYIPDKTNINKGTPASLSNVGYRLKLDGGWKEVSKLIEDTVRKAYNDDPGDGSLVLSELKRVTKLNNWKFL
jgi:hypothetical protein